MSTISQRISLHHFMPQKGERAYECFDKDGELSSVGHSPETEADYLEKAQAYSRLDGCVYFVLLNEGETNEVLGVAFKGQLIK